MPNGTRYIVFLQKDQSAYACEFVYRDEIAVRARLTDKVSRRMSVRRLAEEMSSRPQFRLQPRTSGLGKATIKKYPKGREQSAVIPLLMRAQEQDGWVTKAAIEKVADMLGMAYIRVLEVATFYTQFQLKPVGTRAHVQVCGTTPCMLRGAEDLIGSARVKIHHEPFHATRSGTLSWEEVECQGACVNAPMVMIFKDTYEDLTPEQLNRSSTASMQARAPTYTGTADRSSLLGA